MNRIIRSGTQVEYTRDMRKPGNPNAMESDEFYEADWVEQSLIYFMSTTGSMRCVYHRWIQVNRMQTRRDWIIAWVKLLLKIWDVEYLIGFSPTNHFKSYTGISEKFYSTHLSRTPTYVVQRPEGARKNRRFWSETLENALKLRILWGREAPQKILYFRLSRTPT